MQSQRQVMVQRPQLHGKVSVLRVADVLADNGKTLTVKIKGEREPVVVNAADTLATSSVFGRLSVNPGARNPLPAECPSPARHALANRG